MYKACNNCKYYGMESLICGRCDDDLSCWERMDIPLNVIDDIKAEIQKKHDAIPVYEYHPSYSDGKRTAYECALEIIDEKVKEYTE